MLPEVKEVILLLYSVLVRPNVGNTVSSSRLHTMRDRWKYWREAKERPLRLWKGWNISHVKKGWESWDSLAWKREGSGCITSMYANISRENIKKMEACSFQQSLVTDNGYKPKHRRNNLSIRKHFFCSESCWEQAQVDPGWLWNLPPQRYSKVLWL